MLSLLLTLIVLFILGCVAINCMAFIAEIFSPTSKPMTEEERERMDELCREYSSDNARNYWDNH